MRDKPSKDISEIKNFCHFHFLLRGFSLLKYITKLFTLINYLSLSLSLIHRVNSVSTDSMADRVHPTFNDQDSLASPLSSSEHPLRLSIPSPGKPVPPPGTYVIQIPKDQVYRVPPPENAHRFERYTRRKPRQSRFRCCVCSFLAILTILCAAAAVSAAVLYLVYRPESPQFSVVAIAIRGVNASSQSPEISPAIGVTLRARNPNKKLGFYYGKQSSVKMFYSDVEICDGVMPPFYNAKNNATVFKTALKGPAIDLTATVKKELRAGEKTGKVPLRLTMRIPVRVKVGAVKTWTLAVRVRCALTVNKLTADAKIVSSDCDRSWKLWW